MNEKEKPWYKRKESLKTRILFFIFGSLASVALIILLFINKFDTTEFLITITVVGSVIITSAIIIIIVILYHQRKEKAKVKD